MLLVALGLAAALGLRIAHMPGGLASLPCFGSQFAAFIHPPAGAATCGTQGYDGQFFFLQAHDPLLLHASTVQAMRAAGQVFRIQRLGYPLLALLMAGGQASAIPAGLLVVNVLVLLGLTAWLAAWAQRHGRSPLWAVAVGLMPGMLLPVLRDLGDPLATAGTLIGVLAWQERRRTTAGVALTVAVLTREVAIAVVLALAAETGLRAWNAWRARGDLGAGRAVIAEALSALGVPLILFGAWQAYVMIRAGGPLGTSSATFPLLNFLGEARTAIRYEAPGVAGWEIVYLALMLYAVALSVVASWRERSTIAAGELALCVSILVPVFGDYWSDTRVSAPLFALLLLDGLQRHDRRRIALGTVAAAMTLFILPAV